jgi:two-component system nitrate/nitrite sensor histidine kinase NarX
MDGMETTPPDRGPARHLLAEVAAGVAGTQDLHDLLQRFLDPVMRLAGAQAAAVRVLGDGDDRLHLVGEIGLPPQLQHAEAAMDRHCGYCGAAADGQRVVWAGDLQPCRSSAGVASACAEGDPQRMLAVPLQHRGRVLGVYNLYFHGGPEPAAEVQALLKSVGELLGLALHNARLEAENLRATLLHERQALAAEVHDSIAQSLAFVKMRLPLLHDAIRAHDDEGAQRYYDDVRGGVTQAHGSLRSVITHLRVPPDPRGLLHALHAGAETFRRSTGTQLDVDNALPGLRLKPEVETQVFHVVQEALANVARHAAAQHAWLRIAPLDDALVEFMVEDDGAGLAPDAQAKASHYGLQIMRERAERVGGTLKVGERPGGGTRVRLVVPRGDLAADDDSDAVDPARAGAAVPAASAAEAR